MAKRRRSFVRWLTALIAWLGVIAPTGLASAQQPMAEVSPGIPPEMVLPSNEARLEALENDVQRLMGAAQEKSDAGQDGSVHAGRPTFQMGGLLHIDYLWIGQNAANRASVGTAEDVFGFRRARLTARGEAYDVVEYAIGFDFALSGRPSFLDNWVAVTDLPVLGNVRAGHYFEPFSLERYTVVRYTTFMERSLADAFAPARNLGIMAHDTIGEDELGTWALGWFRSDSNVFGDDFSNVGGNAVTGRATWLPYYDQDRGGRSLLHVGSAYSFRATDNHTLIFQSFPEARAGTPGASGIPPFVDTGTIAALNDQRLGLEFALVHGPLYVQSEYMCSWVDQIGGPPLFFQGAYAFASYFLTGENRTYNRKLGTIDRVYPYENFFRVRTDEGTQTGCGAWEIAARWSYIDLNSQNIQGGRLNDVTLGLNWHLNPYTRVKWEYVYAMLDRAPVGESFAQIAGMRFDMDF